MSDIFAIVVLLAGMGVGVVAYMLTDSAWVAFFCIVGTALFLRVLGTVWDWWHDRRDW
jgi:hypothetical protein